MGVFISRRRYGLCTLLCTLGPLSGGACGIERDYHHFQQLTQDPVNTTESGGSSFPGTSSGSGDAGSDEGSTRDPLDTTGSSTGVDTSGDEGGTSTSTGEAAPVCGNFTVEGDEECDSDDPGCHGCIRDRLIFVTAESISGAFASEGDLPYYCNHFADLAGLLTDHQRRFQPWLSNGSASASDRLDHSPGRYVLLSGDVVAESWEDLVDGELLHAPNIDEFGELRELEVWTGSLPDGSTAPGAADCDGWFLDDINVKGSWGHSGYPDGRWSYWADASDNPTTCAAEFSLYCVESP